VDELFPLVNNNGEVTGCATRNECHSGSKLLHPVVHLHVFNKKGEILLQKRSMNKDIQPGKWDTSVGGHVDYGETVEEALFREVREELGIISFVPQFVCSYIFESEVERELVYAHMTIVETSIHFNPDEIDEVRFWTTEEIEESWGKGVFTPNFEGEWRKIQLYTFSKQNQTTFGSGMPPFCEFPCT
jgi:isopentenyl-diphosphate delta-isomerase type 1